MEKVGIYYQTAVGLRADANKARESYPEAMAEGRKQHADVLIRQAVGLEIAAAVYCVAQAIEDHMVNERNKRDRG